MVNLVAMVLIFGVALFGSSVIGWRFQLIAVDPPSN